MTFKMHLLAALMVAALLTSCQYGEEFKTYNFRTDAGEWAIDYPPYMRLSKNVYPGAEFQASNSYRDTYVFTRQVSTAKQPTDLIDSLSSQLFHSLENAHVEVDTFYYIGETGFHSVHVAGDLNKKRLYYILSVIDDGERLFHFSAWMFDSKRDTWGADLEKSLNSWRP